MSKPISIAFNFTDGTSHDASVSEASDSVEICNNYGWLIIPKSTGLDQNPTYSIEVSDDDSTWFAYDPLTVDAAIDQPFDDTHLIAQYIRINYNAQTNTTGSVSFDLTLKG